MTLQIDLTPTDAAWLDAEARRKGVEPAEIVRKLVHEQAALALSQESDPTLALFDKWDQEDAAKTPEQLEDEARMWEEFQQGINATRRSQGMRQL